MKYSPALSALLFLPLLANAEPIAIGDRLELFADDFLIAEKTGDLDFHVHQPEPKKVVLTADEPWEGNTSGYFGVFQDGDLYRMVYRGWQHNPGDIRKEIHDETTCLAVSDDGITWRKPKLGVREFEGSKENNLIWTGMGCHNFTAFLDTNPEASPDGRYKALGGGKGGLIYFKSPDCVNWAVAEEKPVITEGAFDSQNLAFWDPDREEYRAYWRIFTDGVRAIRTATSQDFVNWEPHVDLTYAEGTPNQHLYTNAIQKYHRAPHLFVGFPTRYLPKEGQRVEPIFMISRDGVEFTRYNKPVVPESAPKDRKGNRSNYMVWGMLSLPGKPDEISVYATEAYYGPAPGRVRRFVYRLDGFVSLEGSGQATTKSLIFEGKALVLNYAANEGGSVRVELQDERGQPIDGFTASDCEPLTGDSVKTTVAWNGGHDLTSLDSKPVRVHFLVDQASLYSMRFR